MAQKRFFIRLILLAAVLILLVAEAMKPQNWAWLESFMSQQSTELADELDSGREIPPLPGLDMTKLQGVRDSERIFSSEADAWNHLATLLAETPEKTLEKHCVGRVLYAQMSTQPEVYRGKVVRSCGTAVSVQKLHRMAFEMSVPEMYQIMYLPIESPEMPAIVSVLALPEGFPEGENLREQIAFTGIFYKVNPYATVGKEFHFAPLMMAKTVRWTPQVVAEEEKTPFPFWIPLLFAILLAGICWTFFESMSNRSVLRQEDALPETFEMPEPVEPAEDGVSLPPDGE